MLFRSRLSRALGLAAAPGRQVGGLDCGLPRLHGWRLAGGLGQDLVQDLGWGLLPLAHLGSLPRPAQERLGAIATPRLLARGWSERNGNRSDGERSNRGLLGRGRGCEQGLAEPDG